MYVVLVTVMETGGWLNIRANQSRVMCPVTMLPWRTLSSPRSKLLLCSVIVCPQHVRCVLFCTGYVHLRFKQAEMQSFTSVYSAS